MKTVQEFAQLCGTTAKTIRFYDRIGVLKAEYTAQENGYRYYRDTQKKKYDDIRKLQQIGFSLEEIRGIAAMTDEQILHLLREKENALRKTAEQCAEMIRLCEKCIAQKEKSVTTAVIHRMDDQQMIILEDGEHRRIFHCRAEGMDICHTTLNELFCGPYLNLYVKDIPTITDKERTVTVQRIETDLAEMDALIGKQLFPTSDAGEPTTVFLHLTLPDSLKIEDVDRIAARITNCLPSSAMLFWGVSFHSRMDSCTLQMIGIF